LKIIYADNAATTKVMPEVFESMKPFFEEHFGNPSSLYSIGRFSKNVLEKSRKSIADCINAKPNEIFFTSGGTESDNWALKSCVRLNPGDHVITSKIEHHAVLKSAKYLETQGIRVTYLDVDKFGLVNPESLEKEINQGTKLVSIMTANNEIGTIEPISELSKICRKKNVKFHTDAVQAVGHIEIDVEKMGIDMLSASAHKFGGPKGIGFLYIKNGIASSPLIHGGAQESNRRAGTENIPYIVGMAKALEISCSKMDSNRSHLLNLQKKLVDNILSIEETILTGHPTMRTPGSASFCFKGIEGESLLLHLDALGICGSSGSACTSGSLDPSHVLLAIGLPHEVAHGSLRLTLGPDNTMEDVDYIISVLPSVVKKLRLMSPIWEKMSK
jgi:cysteine desulfurase